MSARKKAEDEANTADAPVEDYASDDSEFDGFRDLAGKLVQVPKTELDEKLKDA